MLIGFCGPKGCGKTTSCNIIQNLLIDDGKSSTVKSFAGPLKELLIKMSASPSTYFYSQEYKEKPVISVDIDDQFLLKVASEFDAIPGKDYSHLYKTVTTPRELMQLVGTEFLRDIDKDIHTKQFIKRLDNKLDFTIVEDIRFKNELELIKAQGGRIIYLQNNKADCQARLSASESEYNVPNLLPLCDYVVDNNGDIRKLIDSLHKIVLKLYNV